MIKWLAALVLLSSFPIGYLLAWLCKDELVDGRKYFISLAIASLIASLVIAFINMDNVIKFSVILGLFYMIIVSLISGWKSYDKKFLGKYVKERLR